MSANTALIAQNLFVVPEKIVQQCARALGEEENNFRNFLEVAAEFREAGLTPLYLCNEDMKNMHVTTEEFLRKKFH